MSEVHAAAVDGIKIKKKQWESDPGRAREREMGGLLEGGGRGGTLGRASPACYVHTDTTYYRDSTAACTARHLNSSLTSPELEGFSSPDWTTPNRMPRGG
jgi:hypothetical protein